MAHQKAAKNAASISSEQPASSTVWELQAHDPIMEEDEGLEEEEFKPWDTDSGDLGHGRLGFRKNQGLEARVRALESEMSNVKVLLKRPCLHSGVSIEEAGKIPLSLAYKFYFPKNPRIDIPVYKGEGDDVIGWLYQLEHYFAIHNNMTEEEKVDFVVFYLKDYALTWFQWLEKRRGQRMTWGEFSDEILAQFGPIELDDPEEILAQFGPDPMGTLIKLQQQTTVRDYHRQFMRVSSLVDDLPESHFVSIFVSGLKDELKYEVMIKRPKTVVEAYRLASSREQILDVHRRQYKAGSSIQSSQTETSKRFPIKEVSEEEESKVSSNAIASNCLPGTVMLMGTINKKTVRILLGTGSTHNFVDPVVANKLGLLIDSGKTIEVTNGVGHKLQSSGVCMGVLIYCQGAHLKADLHVLSLGGCQLLLGVEWMSSLDALSFDFKNYSVKVLQNGQTWQLHGLQPQGKNSK